ncbi:Dephospho-CoA kinase [Trichostrongylus colubriformis]|uniref:Dephospho-CoA kinase domain-containing protein n=1 Tax=Trichostrongylus colubriformis TaxID=6319 RepID=A0AAN8J257_TRICO
MVIVGLTGGIATGKSSVSEIFRNHGMHVVDADLIARKVVEPGHGAYRKLRSEFGDEFFDINGALDRPKMAAVVFNDAEKRRKLNSILHPAIRWEMFMEMLKYLLFGGHYIVLDTPLLFESGYHKILWTVIVVWCDDDIQLKRLMLRDNLTKEEALSRIASQFPMRKKMELATVLIENNGTKEELRAKVEVLIRELESRWTPLFVRTTVYSILACCSWIILRMSFSLFSLFGGS